ncbi:MAG: cytochrome b/b6 domain-containing protein [Burkholderiales bacterium]|nr:cytochrome b/b6 domain-containing protein [Burkholderiales bacterium]
MTTLHSATDLRPVRVWDLPTRIFHWSLALLVITSVVTVNVGGNAMTWHFRAGYAVIALLGFRLVWGLIGGRWSRFASFIYAPGTVLRYLRGEHRPGDHFEVGHNPLGSLSVFGLLAVLLLQVSTGLFADDEIANSGPLVRFVSGDTSSLATQWHADIGAVIIYVLVGLHLAAIVFYRWRKRLDLVTPMLKGDKLLPPQVPPSVDSPARRLLAAALLLACGVAVAWMVSLGA